MDQLWQWDESFGQQVVSLPLVGWSVGSMMSGSGMKSILQLVTLTSHRYMAYLHNVSQTMKLNCSVSSCINFNCAHIKHFSSFVNFTHERDISTAAKHVRKIEFVIFRKQIHTSQFALGYVSPIFFSRAHKMWHTTAGCEMICKCHFKSSEY